MSAAEPKPERRQIGQTDLKVTPVGMGCWPIAGITTLHTTPEQSRDTLRAAYEAGINHFDTAFVYGHNGESERMIGETLSDVRDELIVASKGGQHWEDGKQLRDGRPGTLRRELETSLERLGWQHLDLYYLHSPDPQTPLEESAAAIRQFREEGLIRGAGLSNCNIQQLEEFHAVCPLAVCQPRYNMLQREIEEDLIPWCAENQVSVISYWPLMKGLLAGHLTREHVFESDDPRTRYPIFQSDQWEQNQDFLDCLREIAAELDRTVPQVVLNWTMNRSGITTVLAGAKRPDQIRDNAAAMEFELTANHLARIDRAISERGTIRS